MALAVTALGVVLMATVWVLVRTESGAGQAVAPGPCEHDPDIEVEGAQPGQLRLDDVADGSLIDLTGATWIDADSWPIDIRGGSDVCVEGGEIQGTFPESATWDEMHSTGAINVSGPRVTVRSARVDNYGDGIRIRDDSEGFEVRDARLSYIRDDCVENDRLFGGLVTDSFLDGCYVAFSARPKSSDEVSDGRDRTVKVTNSLVRLRPMPTVYRGDAPGHGGFFKWSKDGRGPALELHDNVFRVDQAPNHTGLGVPDELADCSNNTMVWLGGGPFPDPLPSCFTVTTDPSVWDVAVADWDSAH